MKEQSVIVCDKCQYEFESGSIEFKKTHTKIDGKDFEIVYFKCPNCNEVYVVCMLDYWGKKLQNKYVAAMDSYRKAFNSPFEESKLEQKLRKVETLKDEAMSYQNELLHKYKDAIPEGILK